jgi:anti-anti-sigma factor
MCLAYADDAELLLAERDFLDDGLAQRQRLLYVADTSRDEMRRRLGAWNDVGRLEAEGALVLVPVREVYDVGSPIIHDEQIAKYDAMVEQALADGYTGLRIVAEVTTLLADPRLGLSHAAWERAADHYIASKPVVPMCAYDRRLVAHSDLRAVACVHPTTWAPFDLSPFRMFVADDAYVLEGEIDALCVQAFDDVLSFLPAGAGGLTIDGSGVDFIDARGVLTLVQHADRLHRAGAPLRVADPSPVMRRVIDFVASDEPSLTIV